MNEGSKDEQVVAEIAERWSDVEDVVFCGDCMYEAIRHWNRNMDPACERKKKETRKHPDDRTPLEHASKDVHTLLRLVAKLMKAEL
jgi:hypothetical protein